MCVGNWAQDLGKGSQLSEPQSHLSSLIVKIIFVIINIIICFLFLNLLIWECVVCVWLFLGVDLHGVTTCLAPNKRKMAYFSYSWK